MNCNCLVAFSSDMVWEKQMSVLLLNSEVKYLSASFKMFSKYTNANIQTGIYKMQLESLLIVVC